MADSPASMSGAAPPESAAQEKARLRRERRAAKIAAGGADRLQAISSLQGGSHRDFSKDVPGIQARPSTSTSPKPRSTTSGKETPDPDEVDISQHHYTPASQPRLPSPFSFDGDVTPPAFFPEQAQDPAADPIMAMMQQMMGGAGGMPGGPGQAGGPPGDLPPGLANLFSAMGGSGGAPEPSPEQSSAWIWRLVHSLFSVGLAIFIVLRTPFTGTKLHRTAAPGDVWMQESGRGETFAHFFYLFATFEVIMQSSRYFIEKGHLQGGGILSTIGAFLPEPYAGYVRVVGRYSVIYSTVVSDAMVVVFVLGAAAWWNGDALA
ncbi:hypothetical protein K458DRAFT_292124 [Lentithecium fluviatile CBS 122367]|uniref:GET complex, subunit GET2 n=1 Tax=Lentithecium fluviatile CBS 122367 TaxID=1168545 RepID=A0A6G1JHV5_9PLEO|nr:hypothetical protein K458DRAFT_292124 [Lentithecium fluviatile CBS 122367]